MLESSDTEAKVNWIADYTFTAGGTSAGRHVTNNVTATMKFRDGLIIDHRDEFSFYKWASQALGPVGRILGWTPFIKAKVTGTARGNLAKFQSAN